MVKGGDMLEDEERYMYVPVTPISPSTVNRCARSAHTLPLTTTRSHVDTCASLAANFAALSLATFCCGVSADLEGPEGPEGLAELFMLGEKGEEGGCR